MKLKEKDIEEGTENKEWVIKYITKWIEKNTPFKVKELILKDD